MASRQLLKALNRSSILNAIKAYGPIARADIARVTRLSPAAVTQLTEGLIQDGLIFEKQEGDSRGGRRPILLALNDTDTYVVGVKLAETQATLALTDLNADILARHRIQLTALDPATVCDELADGIQALLRLAQVEQRHILGVGVGLAGIVDSAAGICRLSPYNGWRDVPLADLLAERLNSPVYLDNDVNTLTLVERLYGPGQHVRDFLVLTIGRGVGMGMVANGQVYRGTRGSGGEFGHVVVDTDGFLCACGNRGCLETFVADPWLVRRATINGLDVATPEALLEAAQAGNPVARHVFQDAGRVFGQSIANLINLFNPALIIVSGEGVRAGDYLFPAMREAMQRHTFGQLIEDVEMRIEPLSDDTWARGAASLVLGRIFAPSLNEQPIPVR
ncbi:MAG: ROK family transcriptional regulator [Chloroflexi bacterium]|nr:ROK family transcriptional regulator [Chloroflexota bacterium]